MSLYLLLVYFSTMNQKLLYSEFDRQLNTLLEKGYPDAAVMSQQSFIDLVQPLIDLLTPSTYDIDYENGTLPFVVVVSHTLVPTEFAMTHTSKDNKTGIVKLFPHEPSDFEVISDVEIPKRLVYLIMNVDRGKDTINLAPKEAFELITKDYRSPLTIDEGVAIVTHYPDFLKKNNCFSLLASRNKNDKRVPAIWISAHKQPNLGWCWDGNPHTWLGSASCGERK
jgi:hypothetical protein